MDVVYALSIHATYKCQQSGVCCSSNWDVPVDVPLYRTLEDALGTGRLRAAADPSQNGPPLILEPDLPDEAAAMVASTESGHCVFYHRGSGLCVIQCDMGEEHLPSACRYFPRLAVRDRRGTFISLTHYCPTAAAMLFAPDEPIVIVESPAAFPPADYEGLRVDEEAWPPLLHPDMLMDLDGYSAWERHMVARCNEPRMSPDQVIAALQRDARALRAYTPADGLLTEAIANLRALTMDGSAPVTWESSVLLHAEVLSTVPDDVRPEPDGEGLSEAFLWGVVPEWAAWHVPLRRYLAAKAFANWTAYQGRGVLTIVRGLEAALAFVRVEAARECRNAGRVLDAELLKQAFRATDFVLNHIAVGESLAEAWSKVED